MIESWEIKKFTNCLQKVRNTTKITKKQFLNTGLYPVISQEASFINGYWDNKEDLLQIEKPVVIFGDHTKVIKYVDFSFVRGADGVKVLLPIEEINSKFFSYQIQSIKLRDLGYARHYRLLKEEMISIPPLNEQKEIVSILDDAFASIDKAKANIERNIENAKELFQSKLNEIFSQTKYALEKKLGDVCEKITDGSHNPPKNNNGNRIMISGRNITNSGLDLTKVRRISEEDFVKENKRTNLKAGDVLLTIVGTIGRSIVFPANVESLALQRSVAVFKLQEEINSYYLSYYFKSPLFQNLLNDNARGVAQRGVYLKTLRELPFYDNSLKSQNEIVETLDILDNHIQSILLTFEKELENLEELKKSILQKAFSGELTNKSVAA